MQGCAWLRCRMFYFFFFSVVFVVAGPRVALARGRVRLAPSVPAEAPITEASLAFGPRVTVLVQPDAAKMSVPTTIVTNVFIIIKSQQTGIDVY